MGYRQDNVEKWAAAFNADKELKELLLMRLETMLRYADTVFDNSAPWEIRFMNLCPDLMKAFCPTFIDGIPKFDQAKFEDTIDWLKRRLSEIILVDRAIHKIIHDYARKHSVQIAKSAVVELGEFSFTMRVGTASGKSIDIKFINEPTDDDVPLTADEYINFRVKIPEVNGYDGALTAKAKDCYREMTDILGKVETI